MKWTKDTPKESAVEYRDSLKKSVVGRYRDSSEQYPVVSSMHLNKDTFLLDAGCGTGRFLLNTVLDQEFVGLDLSQEMLRVTKEELGRGSFVISELEHLPFKDDSFDEIICIRVLQHIKDQEKAVKELSRVCKSKGYVIVQSYNSWTLQNLYKRLRMSRLGRIINIPFKPLLGKKSMFSPWPFEYDNYCSMPELSKYFKKAGLVIMGKRGATIGFPWMFYESFNPRILDYYFRLCAFIEKRIAHMFPFNYFMDKVTINGQKSDAA